jgi:hypothetical protein
MSRLDQSYDAKMPSCRTTQCRLAKVARYIDESNNKQNVDTQNRVLKQTCLLDSLFVCWWLAGGKKRSCRPAVAGAIT